MGLIDRVAIVDEDRHCARRVDISQVLDALQKLRLVGGGDKKMVTIVSQEKAVID